MPTRANVQWIDTGATPATATTAIDYTPAAGSNRVVEIITFHGGYNIDAEAPTVEGSPTLTAILASNIRHGNDSGLWCHYIKEADLPAAPFEITGNASGSCGIAMIVSTITDVDQTTPLDVTPVSATGDVDTGDPPGLLTTTPELSITPTTDGTLISAAYAANANRTISGYGTGQEFVDRNDAAIESGTIDLGMALCFQHPDLATAGTVAMGFTQSSNQNRAAMAAWAWRPAATGSVTPSTATLSLTGYAPTVVYDQLVTPSTATLTLTGYAPTAEASTNASITPSTATLSLTGYAPSVLASADEALAPTTATLTLTGYAPSVVSHLIVTPQTATLSLTGYAPSIDVSGTFGASTEVEPGTATLTLTGYAPTIVADGSVSVQPTASTLSLTGYAPTADVTGNSFAEPSTATLSLTGYAPSVNATANQSVQPSTATLSLTGYAPAVNAVTGLIPQTATLSLTGYAPSLVAIGGVSVEPSTATLTLTGYTPVIASRVPNPSPDNTVIANARRVAVYANRKQTDVIAN